MAKARWVLIAAVAIGLSIVFWALVDWGQAVAPGLTAGQVPRFRLRLRVISIEAQTPGSYSFNLKWNLGKRTMVFRGGEWSEWQPYTTQDAEAALRTYPMLARRSFPMVVKLVLSPVKDPTVIEAQLKFEGVSTLVSIHGELFGPTLGILVWRDQVGAPHAASMAQYNQRYWKEIDANSVPSSLRPKRLVVVDRFIGGDDDRLDWRDGIAHVAKLGINTLLIPPLAPLRGMLFAAGVHQFAIGANITGGPLGLWPHVLPLDKWVSSVGDKYFKAGYSPGDFSLFALADEPSWYYPMVLQAVDKNPALLEKFRSYLGRQGLTPAMLGAASWEQIHPMGHAKISLTTPLSTRRLFYWTCRFFSWYAADRMLNATNQLHEVFSPKLKTFSNWNNFAGQFYFEGFPKNPDPHSPDAAMGAPDWFEFGRLHGADLMWTEDWLGNERAYQWSFYAAKLRSVAYESGLEFGGYVIGRAVDKPLEGLLQSILSLIGSGAKAVFYYNFGPEYNFPENCYSEVPGVPAQLAHADRMMAAAEDVLWPGRRLPAEVAILQPRSAEVWDGIHIPHGSAIFGVASNKLNVYNLGYMAEVFDEYLALQMSNIPVDFIDEDGLTVGVLKHYKALYITEPDIPDEGQRAIAEWVRSGGTLAMVPGAAGADRYDEPAGTLSSLAGSPHHERAFLPSMFALKRAGTIEKVPIFGEQPAAARGGRVTSLFDDHTQAISQHAVGRGRVIYFAWFPGVSYARLVLGLHLQLLDSVESSRVNDLVLIPVRAAGISTPVQVNIPRVETPMLVSPAGAAITLLNWTGRNLPSVTVRVRIAFAVAKAVSMTHGPIGLRRWGNEVAFSLPLGAADVVALRR